MSQPQRAATTSTEAFHCLSFNALKKHTQTPSKTRVQRDSLKSKATLTGGLMFAKTLKVQIKGPTDTSKLVQDKNQFKTAVTPSPVATC